MKLKIKRHNMSDTKKNVKISKLLQEYKDIGKIEPQVVFDQSD